MAYFLTNVLDNQIKALPTVDTASGSVASFDTDLTENLIECVIDVSSGSDSVSIFVNSINIWNEQWELGAYNTSNGNPTTTSNQIRSKNTFKVLPNTSYFAYISAGTIWAFFYDSNDNLINTPIANISQSAYAYAVGNKLFTTPSNATKMKFYCTVAYGTIYNHDISINYPSTDTEYHAFNGYYITFGETMSGDGSFDVLSGILTRSDDTTKQLDANYIQTINGINNIWCDTNGDTRVKFLLTVGKKIA